MTELIFQYVSLEGVSLLILVGVILSLYSRNKVEVEIFKKIDQIQNSVDGLREEQERILAIQETIQNSTAELEQLVKTSDQKIAELVNHGYLEDIATDLVLSDEGK